MPPRVPIVFVFVVTYFAAAAGAGPEALDRAYALPTPPLLEGALQGLLQSVAELLGRPAPAAAARPFALELTAGEALALAAAIGALPDSAWRPAQTAIDRLISLTAMAVTLAAPAFEPALLTPGYAILMALSLGDGVAALGAWRRERREAAA